MLHRLRDHISNCYVRAADARRRAEETADPERVAELHFMEESWRRLAQSYELSEVIEQSLTMRGRELEQHMEWQRTSVAPFDRAVELAVIGAAGIDTIAFPCRRVLKGWIDAQTGEPLDVNPTHWREWSSNAMPRALKVRGARVSAAK